MALYILYTYVQWNLSTKAMLGVKSFDPCREFGCFQSLFFIVVDHCGSFTLAVVKSQVVLQSPFVERFHCICKCIHNNNFNLYRHSSKNSTIYSWADTQFVIIETIISQ